jgi:hypothetical protein
VSEGNKLGDMLFDDFECAMCTELWMVITDVGFFESSKVHALHQRSQKHERILSLFQAVGTAFFLGAVMMGCLASVNMG